MCINSLYSTVEKSQANYSIEISYFHDGSESITKIFVNQEFGTNPYL